MSSLAGVLAAARRGAFQEALRLAEGLQGRMEETHPDAAHLANIRGGIAFEQGQLEEAERGFETALRLGGQAGLPRIVAKASNNLASIAHLRGKMALAVSLYASALSHYRREGDHHGVAETEHNLAVVQREAGELDVARRHSANAVTAARRTGDAGLIALALLGVAETASLSGNGDTARRTLAAARALARQAEDRLSLVEVLRLRGLMALQDGRFRVALKTASRAYLGAFRLGSPQLAAECAALAAHASRHLSRPRLAERFRRRATETFHRLGAVAAIRRLDEAFAA